MAAVVPPRCVDCEDRGWLLKTGDDGVERAAPCDCRRKNAPLSALAGASIPQRYEHCSIQRFTLLNDSLTRAREAAEAFVRDYPQNEAGLLFSGPCGSGKTHLAVGILNEIVNRFAVRGLFVDCTELIHRLQDSIRSDELRRRELLRPVENAEILVLDDLGGTRSTDWVREILGALINHRYNQRGLTLVTTRLPDQGPGDGTLTARVGAAVRSRLYEMCIGYSLEADDYRRLVKNASH